jgi:hypothetical protein
MRSGSPESLRIRGPLSRGPWLPPHGAARAPDRFTDKCGVALRLHRLHSGSRAASAANLDLLPPMRGGKATLSGEGQIRLTPVFLCMRCRVHCVVDGRTAGISALNGRPFGPMTWANSPANWRQAFPTSTVVGLSPRMAIIERPQVAISTATGMAAGVRMPRTAPAAAVRRASQTKKAPLRRRVDRGRVGSETAAVRTHPERGRPESNLVVVVGERRTGRATGSASAIAIH